MVHSLIRRRDFDQVKHALEQAGFVYGSTMDVEFFLDGPGAKIRNAVHLLMAGKKVNNNTYRLRPMSIKL